MKKSDLPQIDQTGKSYVEEWLIENGYSNILKETLQAKEEGLKATGKIEDIIVQVRTFLHPNRPYKLSDYEIDLLSRRADKLKSAAYAAYVILNDKGKLAEDIIWERLS